jgi:hypothetical protein
MIYVRSTLNLTSLDTASHYLRAITDRVRLPELRKPIPERRVAETKNFLLPLVIKGRYIYPRLCVYVVLL